MAGLEGRIIFPGVEDRTTVDEIGERSVTSTVGHDEHAVWSFMHETPELYASFQQGIQEPGLASLCSAALGHQVQHLVDCWAYVGNAGVVFVRLFLASPGLDYEVLVYVFRSEEGMSRTLVLFRNIGVVYELADSGSLVCCGENVREFPFA